MSDLTLYSANPSRGVTNQWLLEELNVPYALKLLNLDNNEHKSPEYLAINPMGKVPTLCHGDTVVTESAAINMYLAELYPEKGLGVPVGSPLRGEYLRWCFYAPVTMESAIVAKALDLTHPDYQPFADVEVVADTLRDVIGEREYIVGDTFTAADIAVGSAIFWGHKLMPVLPKYPELVAYLARIESRPAWQTMRMSSDS